MRVQKKGKVIDIPIKRGTIMRMRAGGSGNVMKGRGSRAIVVGFDKPSAFSRAYGKQALVCMVGRDGASIRSTGAGDLYPVGSTKRMPKVCREELAAYKKQYDK